MRIKYSRETDILMIHLAEISADYAQESNGLITHLSSSGEPVLLEIQGGREFLLGSITSLVTEEEVRLP
jgi:hypothetical protein